MNKKTLLKKIKYGMRFLPDEMYIQLYYFSKFKRFADLKHPRTFNEKLNWLKLHDRNPLYTKLVDKYEVKPYVADLIGEEYIIPTLGVWDHFDDIDFDLLPYRFVLKCTHDSEGLVIVKDKKTMDKEAAREKLESALKTNFYYIGREWPYKNVKPRIIAEQYMEDKETRELRDYKFFCFGGEPQLLYIATGRGKQETKFDYYDLSFNHLDIRQHYPNAGKQNKPQTFETMIEKARILAKSFKHVRVDFYEVNGRVFFGEMTFFHLSGFQPFVPEEWDRTMGEWISIPMEGRK